LRETQTQRVIHWKMIGDLATVSTVTLEYSKEADMSNPQVIATSIDNDENMVDTYVCTKNTPGAGETTGCYPWTILTMPIFQIVRLYSG